MRIIVIALLIGIGISGFAQDNKNCYQQYADKFAERGSKDVEDGWHQGVVITFRQGENAECFTGKVKVENGAVKLMFRQFSDGEYEQVKEFYKYETEAIITNGISKTLITKDDRLINVIFTKKIKPKKKEYIAAPSADDL